MDTSTLTVDELVRAWKDPASRVGDLDFHPAGHIDLDLAGGSEREGNPISTISTATVLTTTSTGPCATTVITITTTVTAA